MINILKQPAILSLTKNSMIFEVESTQFFESQKVFPTITLNFDYAFTVGTFFQFEFINPETLGVETIRFRVLVNASAQEGDIKGYETSAEVSSSDFNIFNNDLIFDLKKYKKLNSYYSVILIDNGILEIKAKESIEELIPKNITQSISEGFLITFSSTVFEGFNTPKEREGYQMKALVFYAEPNLNFVSNVKEDHYPYELISTQNISLDEKGKGLIDVSELLNGKIESDWSEIPIPPFASDTESDWHFTAPNLRHYYVQFKEFWNDEPTEFEIQSSKLYCHWGGISTDNEIENESINHILTSRKFLTWIPSGKQINNGQTDFLSFMNGINANSYRIELKIYTNLSVITYTLGQIYALTFRTFIISTDINKYLGNDDLTETPNLLPGEIISKYEFLVSPLNIELDEFELADTFTYYYEDECNKKFILYFNSFGLPETFSTNSNWEETMNISSEVASRGLLYNNSNLRAKNFIFSSQHQNSIVVESLLLKREEARRLQSMINSTHTFVWEDNRWVPVIIETKKAKVWNNSEFTQYLEIELLKANSSDRASFYPTLPTIEVEKDGYGYLFNLNLKGLKYNTIGNLTIFDNQGNNLGNFSYDSLNKRFSSGATRSNWISNIIQEGIYSYSLQLEDFDANLSYIKGVFESKFERFTFLATGGASLFISAFPASGSTFIKYNDSSFDSEWINQDIFPSATILSNSVGSITHKKSFTIAAPTFEDINVFTNFTLNIDSKEFDKLYNLEGIILDNTSVSGVFYCNNLKNLRLAWFRNSPITEIKIGFLPNLNSFLISNLPIDEDALESIIREFWNFRKFYTNLVAITLTTIVTANAETLAIINGTGIYASDGLVQNNFTVTIIP